MDGKYVFTGFTITVYFITCRCEISVTNLNAIIPGQGPSIFELSQLVKCDPVTSSSHYEDYVLAAWLAKNNFDVANAFVDIRANFFLRVEQRMNTILSENFQDMHAFFPYSIDTQDREGRPVIYINIGNWDINRHAVPSETQRARYLRYIARLLEDATGRVKQLHLQGHQNVTQYLVILNLQGFTAEKHLSLEALKLVRTLTETVCNNFPYAAERAIFVNAPFIFATVFAYLDDDAKKFFSVFDDPSVYEPFLLDYLEPENIPRDLLPLKSYPRGGPCRM